MKLITIATSFGRLLALWIGILGLLFLSACSSNKQQAKVSQDSPANATDASVASADSTASADMSEPTSSTTNEHIDTDEKLGTKWGDEIDSSVTSVEATRLSDEPIDEIIISYANKNYQGKPVNSISLLAGQIQLSILDDKDKPFPIYRLDGNYYLKAKENQSYHLHYRNTSNTTYQIIASVDGIDVLTGESASKYTYAGYILEAHDELTIRGFRKDEKSVASFTFSKPENSYANHSAQGDISNVGVIGTVIYELELPNSKQSKSSFAPPPTDKPKAFPADK